MTTALEFSRPVSVERLAAPVVQTVVADADERAAIAGRLDIPALGALSCRFELARMVGGRPGEVVADGLLTAEVTRDCVVTLDPFESRVDERFRVRFVVVGTENEDDDPDGDDEIPYEGVVIDLGEAAVEQLALALDPYPRKPGAVLPGEAGEAPAGPFAALARLRPPK